MARSRPRAEGRDLPDLRQRDAARPAHDRGPGRPVARCSRRASGRAQPIREPGSAPRSGRSSTTPRSSSSAPSTRTSEKNGPIWRGGKLTTADHQRVLELLARVVGDLGRGALDADLGAEIDRQLPRGLARLGEVVDRDDAADAHVDRQELVELDQRCASARLSRPHQRSTRLRIEGDVVGGRRRSPAASWSLPAGAWSATAAGVVVVGVVGVVVVGVVVVGVRRRGRRRPGGGGRRVVVGVVAWSASSRWSSCSRSPSAVDRGRRGRRRCGHRAGALGSTVGSDWVCVRPVTGGLAATVVDRSRSWGWCRGGAVVVVSTTLALVTFAVLSAPVLASFLSAALPATSSGARRRSGPRARGRHVRCAPALAERRAGSAPRWPCADGGGSCARPPRRRR